MNFWKPHVERRMLPLDVCQPIRRLLRGVGFFLMLSISISSSAQSSIKGKISDGNTNLPHVNVVLSTLDSAVVMVVATDTVGEFALPDVLPGEYFIAAFMIGYEKIFLPQFSMRQSNLVLPPIILHESATELSEVVIREDRFLFDQKTDRLVINIEQSITSSGNSILEVLQKSPGIQVNRQSNTITVNGRSGAQVMINNKIVSVPADVVIQMLDGMNASNVSKIELITSPSAKYDAEGSAGIIHIHTKEIADYGRNGSFGLMLGHRWAEAFGGNLNLNQRNKKSAYALDYSITRAHNLHILNIVRQQPKSSFDHFVNDHSRRENVTSQQNLNTRFEWRVSDNTLLNLGITGYKRSWKMEALTDNYYRAAANSIVTGNMSIRQSNIWQSASATVGMDTKVNAKAKVSIAFDYLYYHNNNPSAYDNILVFEPENIRELSSIDLEKETPINFLTGRLDYQFIASPSFTIEGGIKGVSSKFNNDVLVRRLVNDIWSVDPAFTFSSSLKENTGAIYLSSKYLPRKGWEINAGLRYEHTLTQVTTSRSLFAITRDYGYLFPSLWITRAMGNESSLQFSYSKRITRPTYNDLASYSAFWGPNTFTDENASLWPSVTSAIKVGYQVRQWTVGLQFSDASNEIIALQPEVNTQSNALIYRSQNLASLKSMVLTNSYSTKITSRWELHGTAMMQYQAVETSHLRTNVTLKMYSLNLNVVNTLKLPRNFAVEVSAIYQSKTLSGISYYLPIASFNFGIQKDLHKHGILRLSIDDILYTNNWRYKTYLPEDNLDVDFTYDWHNQFLRVTYTRNLGNAKIKAVGSRSGSEDERKRLGQ